MTYHRAPSPAPVPVIPFKEPARPPCSRCRKPQDGAGRYCLGCRRAYAREWRKTHPLTEEQKIKDRARSMAGVYKRRGKLVPKPCACGSMDVQMHHPDYTKPLEVEWVCRDCHLDIHVPARRVAS